MSSSELIKHRRRRSVTLSLRKIRGSQTADLAALTSPPRLVVPHRLSPRRARRRGGRPNWRRLSRIHGFAAHVRHALVSLTERITFLSHSEVLQDLPRSQLVLIAADVEVQTFNAAEVVITKGEIGRFFHIIRKGRCLVSEFDPSAPERTVALDAGRYVGELSLLTNAPRNATVVASPDGGVTTWALHRESFIHHLAGSAGGSMIQRANRSRLVELDGDTRVRPRIAAALHEVWRSTRLQPGGTYLPRPKRCQLGADTTVYDIANLNFKQLPPEFQDANLTAAHVACAFLERRCAEGMDLLGDTAFLEEGSAHQHEAWLEQNPWCTDPAQNCAYSELADVEKEKDRAIVRMVRREMLSYMRRMYEEGGAAVRKIKLGSFVQLVCEISCEMRDDGALREEDDILDLPPKILLSKATVTISRLGAARRNSTASLPSEAEMAKLQKLEDREATMISVLAMINRRSKFRRPASLDTNDRARGLQIFDREKAMEIVEKDGLALKHCFAFLCDDVQLCLVAVTAAPRALQFASERVRGIEAVVLRAVSEDGLVLRYASTALRSNRDVVVAAVMSDGLALRYASDELRDDKSVVREAVRTEGGPIRYLLREAREKDWDLRSDRKPAFFGYKGTRGEGRTYWKEEQRLCEREKRGSMAWPLSPREKLKRRVAEQRAREQERSG